jgi:hypothetical protein
VSAPIPWPSIDERKPTRNGYFLVSVRGIEDEQRGYYDTRAGKFFHNGTPMLHITHWLDAPPMPERPR